MKEETLPFFEDLLAGTGTKRDDWVIGAVRIAEAIGDISPANVAHVIERGTLKARRFRAGERSDHVAIAAALKTEIAAFRERRKQEQVKAATEVPLPVSAPGTPAALVQRVQVVPVGGTGTPFLDHQDAEALKLALWGQKSASDVLARAVNGLAASVDANTKATRDHIVEMQRIFEGKKEEPKSAGNSR